MRLGVNIDHVATLREARRGAVPDPVQAAIECEAAGCDSIVCHLREDRRHIKDSDVIRLRRTVKTKLNLEMSVAPGIMAFACRVRPEQATLVPERRQEITTEGGLDVIASEARVARAVRQLTAHGIQVSLFVDPVIEQIDAALRVGARIVELHTGEYANAKTKIARSRQLANLRRVARYSSDRGIEVNAGHGLDYMNTKDVARVSEFHEFNIGHSIISRAVFVGLERAVKEMVRIIR